MPLFIAAVLGIVLFDVAGNTSVGALEANFLPSLCNAAIIVLAVTAVTVVAIIGCMMLADAVISPLCNFNISAVRIPVSITDIVDGGALFLAHCNDSLASLPFFVLATRFDLKHSRENSIWICLDVETPPQFGFNRSVALLVLGGCLMGQRQRAGPRKFGEESQQRCFRRYQAARSAECVKYDAA
jgi:hypothetical protein